MVAESGRCLIGGSRHWSTSFNELGWLQNENVSFELGKADRTLRVVIGVLIGATGILISGRPILGRVLGGLGALVLLSAGCGT